MNEINIVFALVIAGSALTLYGWWTCGLIAEILDVVRS